MLRTGGPASIFHPGAVRLTFREFYQLPFPDSFQNVIIVSFRLTFLRREQRCFPRVWTASYPPSQTWFKGNAVLWFESPLPFVSSPESVFLQGGGRAPQSPPPERLHSVNAQRPHPSLRCAVCDSSAWKVMISAVLDLYGARVLSTTNCK